MGRSRYNFYEEYFPYFLTSSIVEGIPLFANPDIAKIVLDAIVFLQPKRNAEVNAYAVMENHIHLIAKGRKSHINQAVMRQKLEYVHYNPVKRGYVDRPED